MIRTKDFVVLLIAGMLATIGAGFFFISGDAPPRMVEVEEGFFLEPQDGYSVVSHTQTDGNRTRDTFIENVRRAYVPQESPEHAPVVAEPYVPASPTPEIVVPEPNPEPEVLLFPTSTPSAHMSTTTGTSSPESVQVDPGV